MPLDILTLYGSYRTDRKRIRLGNFIAKGLQARGDTAELVDAKTVGLPIIDRMYKEHPVGEAPASMEALACRRSCSTIRPSFKPGWAFLMRFLAFMRFLGLGLGDKVPDAKTIWLFREHLTQARPVENLFARFDKHLSKAGYLAMVGRSWMPRSSRRRNSEKADIKAGKVPDEWPKKPAKLRQKDGEARWTVKFSKGQGRRGWQAEAARHRRSRLRL